MKKHKSKKKVEETVKLIEPTEVEIPVKRQISLKKLELQTLTEQRYKTLGHNRTLKALVVKPREV